MSFRCFRDGMMLISARGVLKDFQITENNEKLIQNNRFIQLSTTNLLSKSDNSFSNGSNSLTSNGQVTDSSWTLAQDSGKNHGINE